MSLKSTGEVSLSQTLSKVSILEKNYFINKLSSSSQSAFSAGYSTKLLNANYLGPTVRIRRGSDNVEQDFYSNFQGNLGTLRYAKGISLDSWLNGSTGFVRTWYDQSGNARNVTQTTNSNQPTIYGTPILDKLSPGGRSAARGIYSLYRASSTYTGATIRIRRSTDNVEQDFYANSKGTLGTTIDGTGTLITSWLNGATAFVRTWYDQSGAGRHAEQTTTSAQPVLNVASLLIDFQNDNARFLNMPSGTVPVDSTNAQYTFILQHGTVNNTSVGGIIGSGIASTNQANNLRMGANEGRGYWNYWFANDYSMGGPSNYAAGNKISIKYDGINRQGYINGTHFTALASSGYTNAAATQFIGKSVVNEYFNGQLYFIYIFGSSLNDADRIICENTRTYDYIPKIHYISSQWLDLTNTQIPSSAMTSNSSNGFISTASASYTGAGDPWQQPYRAFDLNSDTGWHSIGIYDDTYGFYNGSTITSDINGRTYSGEWLQLQCPSSIKLNSFLITPRYGYTRAPINFSILGSNNGGSWNLLYEEDDVPWGTSTAPKLFNITKSVEPYTYFRMITRKVGDNSVQIMEWRLNPTTTPLAAGEKTYSFFANWNSNSNSGGSVITEQVTIGSNNSRAALFRDSSFYGFSGWNNDLISLVNFTPGRNIKTVMIVNDALATNNITMYHNGIVHQGTSSSPTNLSVGTGIFSIGRRGDGVEYFNGYINEVIIISNSVKPTDAMLYFTPNDTTIQRMPFPKPKIWINFDPRDSKTLMTSNDTRAKALCDTSSLQHLPNATAVADWNGFVQNTPSRRPTYYNKSGYRNDLGYVNFNRSGQHLDKGSMNLNIASNGGFTSVCFIQFTGSPGNYERVFSFGQNMLCRVETSSRIYFLLSNNESSSWLFGLQSPDGTIIQNEWALYACRYRSSDGFAEIIKNGKVIATLTTTGIINRTVTYSRIGTENPGSSEDFGGNMAGFALYDYYLTDNEISAVSAELMYSDLTTIPRQIIDYNNTVPTGLIHYTNNSPNMSGFAAKFNNTPGCYYDLYDVPNLPFSFTFWFNSQSSTYQTIMGLGDTLRPYSWAFPAMQIDYPTTTNRLTFYCALSTPWTTIDIDNVLVNTWYHVTVTINTNSQVQVYLNSVYQNQVTASEIAASRTRFVIGSTADVANRGFDGFISDFRIYDYILRQEEIDQIYNYITFSRQLTLMPPENYLVNHYNWYTKMTLLKSGDFTAESGGNRTNVQYRLTNFGVINARNVFYNLTRIQDYDSFVCSFEIYNSNATGDALWFFCGSTAVPETENSTNSGFIVDFQVYNSSTFATQGVALFNNSNLNVSHSNYTSWINASQWTPVIIKYSRDIINTWTINVAGQDIITYSNENNESWILNSGNYWGIGARNSGVGMDTYIRRVELSYQQRTSSLSSSRGGMITFAKKYPEGALSANDNNGCIATSGTTIGGGENSFHAFDQNTNTRWTVANQFIYNENGNYQSNLTTTVSGTIYSGDWLQIKLHRPIKLQYYILYPHGSFTRSPENFVIAGSNDGTNWTLLELRSGITNWDPQPKTFNVNISNYYSFYRIIVTKKVAGDVWLSIGEWELYAYPDITYKKFPERDLTNNTSFNCVASASTELSADYAAFKAFDGRLDGENIFHSAWSLYNSTTGAYLGSVSTNVSGTNYSGEWLQIKMPSSTTITQYTIAIRQAFETSQAPNTWVLAGSNNGSTWTLIDSRTGISNWSSSNRVQTFNVSECTYTYFRIICTVTGQTSSVSRQAFIIGELSFYGPPIFENPIIKNTAIWTSNPNLSFESYATGTGLGSIIPGCTVYDSSGDANNAYLTTGSYRNTKYIVCGSGSGRKTTVNFKRNSSFLNIPTFTQNHIIIVEASTNSGTLGHTIGLGYDQNNNNIIDLSNITEEGPALTYNSNESNIYFFGKQVKMWYNQTNRWVRFRIIYNLQDELASVFIRNENSGHSDFMPIHELTNISLNFDWTSDSASNPSKWNCLYLQSNSDSLIFEGLSVITYDANTWKTNMGIYTQTGTNGMSITRNFNKTYSAGLIQGLTWKIFNGLFNGDMINNFVNTPYRAIGLTNNLTNINTGTNGHYPVNTTTQYSGEWTGYFRPNVSGIWTFYLWTDDDGYFWIGQNALAGYTTSNRLIYTNVSGATGSISLVAGVYYPIRIRFTDGGGLGDTQFSFTSPNGTTSYDGTGYFFSSIGTNPAYPSESAHIIKEISKINIDGVYYINANGFSTPTYCLMNDQYDGGGWMMLMKATRGGTFNYGANYWSTANTLNATQTNRNDGDAKFDTFNYMPIKDVMAIFPDVPSANYVNEAGLQGGSLNLEDGWCWKVNNWNLSTRTTALAGFQNNRDAVHVAPFRFSGYSNQVFSGQYGAFRHIFGGPSHLGGGNRSVRWGFIFNNEGNFWSMDALAGIGMSDPGYSAGDWFNCCGSVGLNRSMRLEMYGR